MRGMSLIAVAYFLLLHNLMNLSEKFVSGNFKYTHIARSTRTVVTLKYLSRNFSTIQSY